MKPLFLNRVFQRIAILRFFKLKGIMQSWFCKFSHYFISGSDSFSGARKADWASFWWYTSNARQGISKLEWKYWTTYSGYTKLFGLWCWDTWMIKNGPHKEPFGVIDSWNIHSWPWRMLDKLIDGLCIYISISFDPSALSWKYRGKPTPYAHFSLKWCAHEEDKPWTFIPWTR